MNLWLNKFNVLIEPDLHDGMMESIDLSNENVVHIGLLAEDKTKYKLIMKNLDRLYCTNLREGNIIFEIEIFSNTHPNHDYLRTIFDLSKEESPEYLKREILNVENGAKTFLSIMPSYGCELHALCKSIELERLN